MKTIPGLRRNQSGSALVTVVILGFVMLLTAAAVFEFAARDAGLAAHSVERSRAFYAAESGLAKAHTWLEAQSDPPPGAGAVDTLFGAVVAGRYQAEIVADAGNPSSARKYYTIVSEARVPIGNAAGDTLVRRFERLVMTQSFAQFIYYTEDEHLPGTYTPVWFCSADYLDGALHTNGQIHILGDPHFAGHVSSAHGGPDDDDPAHVPSFMYYNGDYWDHLESSAPDNAPYDEPVFGDGYELGTTAIDLPEYLDDIEAMALDGGLYLTGDLEVKLGMDSHGSPHHGYLSYRPQAGGEWIDVEISSFNGVMYVSGEIEISGILDGSLTVACGGDIYVVDDVVYLDADPVDGPNEGCNDLLGLVSQQNIIIADNGPNSNDCCIHAHMMALDTSFQVENFRDGSPRGTLYVHGGIIQRYRGAVGTGYIYEDEVVIASGFAKSYNYDERFNIVQPPGYFLTGEYYKLGWRELASE